MKIPLFLVFIFIVSSSMITSCSKKKGCTDSNSISYDKSAEEDDGSCLYAETGGSTTLIAKPQHHGNAIIGQKGYPDSAFIKFNTQDYPGSNASSYDLVIGGEVGEDHVHIPNMKPGKYYIQMTGYDSTDMIRVIGGIPFILTQASGEVVVVVPVTE